MGKQRRLPERGTVITKIQRRHPGKTLGKSVPGKRPAITKVLRQK